MLEHKQEMAQFAEHQQRGGGRKHNSLQMKRGEWASGHWAARVGEVVHHGCKHILTTRTTVFDPTTTSILNTVIGLKQYLH